MLELCHFAGLYARIVPRQKVILWQRGAQDLSMGPTAAVSCVSPLETLAFLRQEPPRSPLRPDWRPGTCRALDRDQELEWLERELEEIFPHRSLATNPTPTKESGELAESLLRSLVNPDFQSSSQLRAIDGLREIVVGPGIETFLTVGLHCLRRQRDDR